MLDADCVAFVVAFSVWFAVLQSAVPASMPDHKPPPVFLSVRPPAAPVVPCGTAAPPARTPTGGQGTGACASCWRRSGRQPRRPGLRLLLSQQQGGSRMRSNLERRMSSGVGARGSGAAYPVVCTIPHICDFIYWLMLAVACASSSCPCSQSSAAEAGGRKTSGHTHFLPLTAADAAAVALTSLLLGA